MTDRQNFPAGPAMVQADCSFSEKPAGKPKRKAIPAHVKVSVAIRQATNLGGLVPQSVRCPLCGFPLLHDQPRVLEHTPARAILVANGVENPDDPKYLSWVHAVCAAKKTNGNKATCADGDIHKIAKAKRLAKAQEVHQAVLAGTHKREPSRIKSRGFAKVHRPFRRAERG